MVTGRMHGISPIDVRQKIMKRVILDHPDWIALKADGKVVPYFNIGRCALALQKHPDTKHWRFALIFFTTLVPLAVIAGIVMLFITWWIGLIIILSAIFPLRQGIATAIRQEVIRVAEENTSFFSCALATGGLRFLVNEEDLGSIEYLDGDQEVPYFMPRLDRERRTNR